MLAATLDAPELLSPGEVREATGRARFAQQVEWLNEHGIPHRVDGRRIILSRAHFRAWIEGRIIPKTSGINWSAVK